MKGKPVEIVLIVRGNSCKMVDLELAQKLLMSLDPKKPSPIHGVGLFTKKRIEPVSFALTASVNDTVSTDVLNRLLICTYNMNASTVPPWEEILSDSVPLGDEDLLRVWESHLAAEAKATNMFLRIMYDPIVKGFVGMSVRIPATVQAGQELLKDYREEWLAMKYYHLASNYDIRASVVGTSLVDMSSLTISDKLGPRKISSSMNLPAEFAHCRVTEANELKKWSETLRFVAEKRITLRFVADYDPANYILKNCLEHNISQVESYWSEVPYKVVTELSQVRVRDLQSATGKTLNGRRGVAVEFCKDSGRWIVQLIPRGERVERKKSLKSENLVVVEFVGEKFKWRCLLL